MDNHSGTLSRGHSGHITHVTVLTKYSSNRKTNLECLVLFVLGLDSCLQITFKNCSKVFLFLSNRQDIVYQSQVSGWQVYFSFQCYVGLAKLTQKFGSTSPIVNCNPGREEITLRKLFLHRLQRVLGTAAASGCQSQQM